MPPSVSSCALPPRVIRGKASFIFYLFIFFTFRARGQIRVSFLAADGPAAGPARIKQPSNGDERSRASVKRSGRGLGSDILRGFWPINQRAGLGGAGRDNHSREAARTMKKKKGEKIHILSSARALTARMGENRVRPPGQRGFTLLALPGVPACGPTRRAGQEGGDERRGAAARNPNLLPEGRGGEEERKINNNKKKKSSTTQRATRFVRRTWDPPHALMDPAESPRCSQRCFWDRETLPSSPQPR